MKPQVNLTCSIFKILYITSYILRPMGKKEADLYQIMMKMST